MGNNHLLLFFKGILMGTADLIPGISGGTIAFITGIYQRLVHSLSTIDLSFIRLFWQRKWMEGYKNLRKIDFAFFIPLGLGIFTAIISLSRLISFLLTNYTAFTFAFFLGLIAASAVFLYRNLGEWRFEKILFIAFGVIIAFVISGGEAIPIDHSLPTMFISGFIAICAMILPGISGAFILLLLNQYEYVITAIHDFNILVLIIFGLGAITGLLTFSRVLDYVLKKFRTLTLSFLIGIMLGSLRVPVHKIALTESSMFGIILFCILGFALVFVTEILAKKFYQEKL